MRLAVLKERAANETRVAATPDTVKKLVSMGLDIAIEAGAGSHSAIRDDDYTAAGAHIVPDAGAALTGAEIVFAVGMPDEATRAHIARGTLLVCTSGTSGDATTVAGLAQAGIDVAAMELLPRITRAQGMDVLSSQANLAGYRAVIEGAAAFDRGFPMMMTAAGTVPPARVFVIGAGVAGLQAIATARRLGALVSATDVRAATKEQIESLGAKAIFVDAVKGIEGEGSGGYATEMSDEYKAAQAALVSSHIAKQDIVITTALIPGRPAPRLVSDAQIATMRPGSVIVDLAVESGGNVEGSVVGASPLVHGVTIIGHRNMPSRLAADASALYARNLYNFIAAFWDKDAGLKFAEDDDIVKGVTLTRGGTIVHERLVAA